MSTRIPLIFGAAVFGEKGTPLALITNLQDVQDVANVFIDAGHKAFDTSNAYANGTSEEYLSKLDLKDAVVDTKVNPMTQPGLHAPAELRKAVERAVEVLSPHKINILYLHAPDHSVPYVDTAREINELHKKGLFKEFGLSNYASWEVAEIYNICKANGWVLPTVYQGVYNALERHTETELFPCLRKYNIKYYAYSPLASGLLTGKILDQAGMAAAQKGGTRWDASHSGDFLSKMLVGKYSGLIPAVQELQAALNKHNVGMTAAAFRWLQHHSLLNENDGIVIGASRLAQLKQNLAENEKGPLPEEIVKVFEETWAKARGASSPTYFF